MIIVVIRIPVKKEQLFSEIVSNWEVLANKNLK